MRGSIKRQRGARTRQRRPKGGGSVYQMHRRDCSRPRKGCDCIWWVSYRGPDALRRAESSESRRKGDAERLLQRKVGQRENNLPVIVNAERLTFTDATKALIDDYTTNGKRSVRVVHQKLAHLLAYFGQRRLVGITKADVTAYVAHRQREGIVRERDVTTADGQTERKRVRIKDVSNAQINRELALLKRTFTLAQQSGRIALRPHIQLLRESAPRRGFFEPAEVASVLKHLPSEIRPVIEFAYVTGWRVHDEVLPLEWRHIDFTAGEVRLDRSKNGDGRVFPMTAALRRLLKAQHVARERLKKAGTIVPWVFWRMRAEGRGGTKTPRQIIAFTTAWKNACLTAGCPGRIPHDLRRTAVRNLVRAGVPQTIAMKLTGHKTDSVFRRYDIVSPNDLRVAVERLDALMPSLVASKQQGQ